MTERGLNPPARKAVALIPLDYTILKDGYGQALSFFMLALGLLLAIILLPRIQTLNISSAGIYLTLKDIARTVDTLVRQSNEVQSLSIGESGIKAKDKGPYLVAQQEFRKIEKPDDPQKGKWGGLSERHLRRISGIVSPSYTPGLYIVEIKVVSISSNMFLLSTDNVKARIIFFLTKE